VSAHQLLIRGTTDLPDDTWISYEVKHENYEKIDFNLLKTDRQRFLREVDTAFAEGDAPVAAGRYSAVIDISNWKPGSVEIWVAFQTVIGKKKQPPAVVERYGQMGEYLQGSNVTKAGGRAVSMNRVELIRTVQIKRGR
jgi:hypothetical protein